jgi:ketosteroid isomerase-like protein
MMKSAGDAKATPTDQPMTSVATVFEPSDNDPRIVAALAARERLNAAFQKHDADAVEPLCAPDLVVNAPINKVADKANAMARFRAQEIAYAPGKTVVSIEFAGVRGDSVVFMGEEMTYPIANAPYAGKKERRRFTDIWNNVGGTWMLAVRQATIISIE